jgi:hypothetical protein
MTARSGGAAGVDKVSDTMGGSAKCLEQLREPDDLAELGQHPTGIVTPVLGDLPQLLGTDPEILEDLRVTGPEKGLGLPTVPTVPRLVLVVLPVVEELVINVDVSRRHEQLRIVTAGTSAEVADEETWLFLTIHPDQREPLVLVFDDGHHRLIINRYQTQRRGQVLERGHIVDLDVTGFPAPARVRNDRGEVRHVPIVASARDRLREG